MTETASIKETITTQKPLIEYTVMGNEYRTAYPFRHFMLFLDSNSIHRDMQKLSFLISKNALTARVKVTGFLPELNYNFEDAGAFSSEYKIQIIKIYGEDTKLKTNGEYMINHENCRLIFDNIKYDITRICFCDSECFAYATAYNTENPDNISSTQGIVKLIMDDSGYITAEA